MHITLNSEQEQFIQAKLQSGKYQSVDDVVEAALHLLEEQDEAYEQWVVDTRAKVDAAAASLDRGEGLDGEQVVNSILDKFRHAREDRG
ncbi:ribbon-helix-helix domain-containing protein [Aliterella atlantica]|uniref:CopG family transcriptional regulator n=1 Tax=Aliterella atlantica CENA595 TaxID=1618023 RepID=A0A0D8ZU40_9CYAN|nr:type II toxin-antitoxin system ParD family antitoxin [Aliterella atlantica]KJH72283.1 CopG family transcriptional regulator [Aliterella atlantica CENA595]